MYQNRTSQEAEKLLLQLGEYSPDVIWMFSPDWDELRFVDGAYEDVWNRSIRTLEDDPTDFLNGIHPADREEVKAKMEQLSDEEPIEAEFRVNDEEEYRRCVWVEGRPMYDEDNEFVAVAGFARDITQRKQYEQELKDKNEQLENFASIVSHDLRSPLTVAEARLDLAQNECNSEHLCHVEGALDRMETMIEELLSLTQKANSVENIQTVALESAVSRCWRNVQTFESTLEIDTEQNVRANESHLQELLENLVRNAVEHNTEDVTIRVGALDDGFYVSDNGSGIPEDERQRVFDHGYSTATDGTGLGLCIINEIVDAHGWEIDISERPDGGARFEVTNVDIGR
ncbi:HAMP domain-containing sensor histidine kinase [Natronomonas sp. LN261]|jgi:PAS domain S-box-containing protein|uniref:sensor histidine kinase n=1 Tax=Natronomonas sp. LN261 TaxID=2750669 RepID=UPI0015EF9715|nr:PAS domain-containing sensor histidine kinase [Natronomonas sp. LN261]